MPEPVDSSPSELRDRALAVDSGVGIAAARRPRFQTFSSLKYRDFRLLWISSLFNSAGQWVEQVALSWLVYDLTGSAILLGAINGMRAIPFLILSPVSGVVADRVDRRRLMLISQSYIMVLSLAMGIILVAGVVEVWHLFVYTLLTGIGWSFTMPVRQSLTPNLVPREALMNAIALNSAAFNSTRIIGPALAGLIIASIGAGGNFLIKAGAYLCIVILMWIIRVPPPTEAARRVSARRSMVEGFSYVRQNQVILTLLILALVPTTLAMPFMSLLPIYAKDILDIGPKGLGLLYSASGVGALAATMTLASLGDFRRKGAVLLVALTIAGLGIIMFSQSGWLPLSLVFLAVVGGSQMSYMALNNTLMQINLTDSVRGRVMGIYMLDQGMLPLGTLLAGTLANFLGAPTAVTIMGAFCSGLAIFAALRFRFLLKLQ